MYHSSNFHCSSVPIISNKNKKATVLLAPAVGLLRRAAVVGADDDSNIAGDCEGDCDGTGLMYSTKQVSTPRKEEDPLDVPSHFEPGSNSSVLVPVDPRQRRRLSMPLQAK